ncbi:hypothetical protein BX666DRAFT_975714 [Dichotomocladium elegans]|nr:hypothetical protein BX666DRAFT_975714 [Dichotomocladium elegans]
MSGFSKIFPLTLLKPEWGASLFFMNTDITTLTSFNFEVPECDEEEDWALSKVFTKFKAAVSGQSTAHSTNSHNYDDGQRSEYTNSQTASASIDDISLISVAATDPGPQSHIVVTSPTPPMSYRENTTPIMGLHTRASTSTAVTTVTASAVPDSYSIKSSRTAEQQSTSSGAGNAEYMDLIQPITKSSSVDSDAQSVSTTFSISTSHSLSRIIARLRGRKSDKEFWMPDEQCRECYKCRKPFKLLRRRHHCRICGQIFCGTCASHTISGKLYKQKGEVRVCNFCYWEHHLGSDDCANDAESEYGMLEDQSQQQDKPIIPSQPPPSAPPKMHIPTATVKQPSSNQSQQYGNYDATTVQLEITTDTSSLHDYPKSSLQQGGTLSHSGSISAAHDTDKECENNMDGSLRRLLDAGTSLLKSRPRSYTSSSVALDDSRYGGWYHGSPSSLQGNWTTPINNYDRGGGMLLAERAFSPFMGSGMEYGEEDEVLEPHRYDLYSRSSSHPGGRISFRLPSPVPCQPPSGFPLKLDSGATFHVHDSVGSDDEAYDNRLRAKRTEELRGQIGQERSLSLRRQSLGGNRAGSRHESNRRHGGIRINTSNLPKADYSLLQSEGWSPAPFISPFDDRYTGGLFDQNFKSRLLTSRNRRISAPPSNVELNYGALMHARRMLKQLMSDEIFGAMSSQSKLEWENVLTSLLLKVADNVRPEVQSGDDMDIRHYIKIKKVPGGVPADSFYVKGVMFTKNVAHKKMVRNIPHPRILILLFPLDYSRAEMENQLMSIQPVIEQEREHIRKLVARIVALRPTLILVKSTVSRVALEYLLEANIPVIHNVKYSVIEAVARCTRASIVSSVDKLQHGGLSLGQCDTFEIRTFIHDMIPNRRKTYLIFDECQPDLGGTIVLRGAPMDTLRLIKRLIDFMVFVVNNLKLENSLLRDSFAKNRSSDQQEGIRSEATDMQNALLIHNDELPDKQNVPQISLSEEVDEIERYIKLYRDTLLSASQFVTFPQPYILTCMKETNDRLIASRASATGTTLPNSKCVTDRQSIDHNAMGLSLDGEYERLLVKQSQLKKAWNAYLRDSSDHINPFYHQNIVILYSNVCTITTVPCQGPEIRIFEYYSPPSDQTLGQYVTDLCKNATQPCSSTLCEHPVHRHYRSYAHGNAKINVMIEDFPCPQPGMSEKILMWSYCNECKKPTPVTTMSENTWNYSFGKFLEICLYQRGVHCRADICPHDIGLHHVRYFGYRDFAIRFQYEPIELLEVFPPPMKLFILSQVQIDLKDAELGSLRTKINRFYQSIIERNKSFPYDLVDPRRFEACKAELQEISQRCDSEKKQVLQILQEVYATTEPYDTLTINWVRRILYQQIAHWDLEYADLVQHYLQPERELRKITASHLRKVFLTDLPEEAIGGERTKRATETNDLPLLGTELDGENISDEEGLTLLHRPMVFPQLGCSPVESETIYTQPESMAQTKEFDRPSFLRPEIHRRLSLELMRELNVKFKLEEAFQEKGAQESSRAKSPVSLLTSAAATPSRIPVLHLSHQQKGKCSPSLNDSSPSTTYHNAQPSVQTFEQQQQPQQQRQQAELMRRVSKLPNYRYDLLPRSEDTPTSDGRLYPNIRPPLFTATQNQNFHHARPNGHSTSRDEESSGSSTRKDVRRIYPARDKHFRSKLPRKKTSLQVYTHVNDLVKENLEDEFLEDEQKETRANDDKSSVDYFTDLAPYSSHVNDFQNRALFPKRYSGVAEAITEFGMELDRHPPPAVDLLEPPPVSMIAGVSASDIRDCVEEREEQETSTDTKGRDGESKAPPEKSSFMKTITSLLTDGGIGNLLPLEYPLRPSEHIFPDSFVIVDEDKPSTIIAYTLTCDDYLNKMHGVQDSTSEFSVDDHSMSTTVVGMNDTPTIADNSVDSIPTPAPDIQETLTRESGTHMGYHFRTGNTKFFCKIFFVEQFDALRRNCGCDESYILSLANCVKWDSSGGKSGSAFLKTADDRLLMKQVSRFELDAFLGFAPAYFHYMSEAFFRELPTVLAKIFGFYTIGYKNSTTGKSMRMDVLVMENLFYQRKIKKIFDLKGSMRNRHVQSTGKQDEVLLDENLVELIYRSPLFIRAHAKEILRSSLHNDTLFLSNRNVMDYSLLVGIDDERQELVVGIVDFIRTFTWDKKLESWVKESGILGGGGKGPTIVSPRQYRIRFREAMERYFLMVPDQWSLVRQTRVPYAGLYHHHQMSAEHHIHQSSAQESQKGTGDGERQSIL